jgi:UDP-glucose 4-epimerase
MTVLVTGVGFIGGYVVRDLIAAGHEVVLYGYLGGDGDPDGALPELEYIDQLIEGGIRHHAKVVVGDVTDLRGLTEAAERYNAGRLVHLATMLSASAEANPYEATRVNVMGTANVFEVAARLGLRKVVWTSSSSVFGRRSAAEAGIVFDDSVVDPEWTYGAAKLMGERLARAYAAKGVNITSIRPTRTYGFGEHVKLTRGGGSSWLAALLYGAAIGQGPIDVPFGTRSVDFLYVEDLAAAIVAALEFTEPDGAGHYLISGDYRPVREAVEFVRRLLPDARIGVDDEDLDLRPGATVGFSMQCDSSRAAAAFGYRQRHSMEAGVYKTVNRNRLGAGLSAIPEPPEARVK